MNRILPMRFFARDITGTIAASQPAVEVQWRAGTLVIDEQGEKLLEIAKNCPAARLLAGEIILDTVLEGEEL